MHLVQAENQVIPPADIAWEVVHDWHQDKCRDDPMQPARKDRDLLINVAEIKQPPLVQAPDQAQEGPQQEQVPVLQDGETVLVVNR